jgi:hypothetical protein
MTQTPHAFDLTDLAVIWDKGARFRWRYLFVGSGMCTLIACAGLFLLLSSPAQSLTERDSGAWILLVGFGLVAVYGVRTMPLVGPAYRRLVLRGDSLSLESGARGRSQRLAWRDPKFKLDIYDRTGLPPTEPDGSPRVIDFLVRPRYGPRTPIPASAFEAILLGAREHGLHIARRPSQGGGDPAGGSLVTISAHPSALLR